LAIVRGDLVNRADVGVIEGRSCACFPLETFQSLRTLRESFWEELQSDVSAKVDVFCFIDDAHASSSESAEDSVVGNNSSDHGW
jgi:hypothetical protein